MDSMIETKPAGRVGMPRFAFCLAVLPTFLLPAARSRAADIPRSSLLSSLVVESDDYYSGRQNLQNVRKALALLLEDVKRNPADYEAWWRISKDYCYLARHADGPEEMKLLEAGAEAGKKSVGLKPERVEGHFWLGANYGLAAEERGPIRGLLLVDTIRREMEAVVKLDPDYEQCAGLRTLARVYYRAPFFKGGDKRKSIEILQDCLRRYPENSLAMLYLSESLLALGRRGEARQQLEKILGLCPDPLYAPELAENQQDAKVLLEKHFHVNK